VKEGGEVSRLGGRKRDGKERTEREKGDQMHDLCLCRTPSSKHRAFQGSVVKWKKKTGPCLRLPLFPFFVPVAVTLKSKFG